MIRHHNELMENVFLLVTVMEQDFHEQPRHRFIAKQRPSLKRRSGNEINAISSVSSGRRCHRGPQRLKPRHYGYLIAALEALRHPKAECERRGSKSELRRIAYPVSPVEFCNEEIHSCLVTSDLAPHS
jgi:hypothetical protein